VTAKRDFLSLTDLSRPELLELLALASTMKAGQYTDKPLTGKSLAMIFAKSSTRTRVSFELGTIQLGGIPLFLSSRDVQIGRGEPVRDTARVLSQFVDGIMIRTFAHTDAGGGGLWGHCFAAQASNACTSYNPAAQGGFNPCTTYGPSFVTWFDFPECIDPL
jgi:ornithine carbamoyltransferase